MLWTGDHCFGQEIIWNNTHKRANKKTIMYRTWYDLGIKSDIYICI